MDGWITIGTKLVTDKFDKQINDLEKKIDKEERKKIDIEAKLDINLQDLENQKKEVNELNNAYKKMQDTIYELQTTNAPEAFQNLKMMEIEYGNIDTLEKSVKKAQRAQQLLEIKAQKTKNQYTEINEKVSEYARKIEGIRINKQQTELEQVKKGFDRVNNAIKKGITNLSRMALSILGIRAGISMLRNASSVIAQYDEQYAKNLEYIRYALAMAVKPILEYIVGLVTRLLSLINTIFKIFTGRDLFKSAKTFSGISKSLSSGAKSSKQIKENLQSANFDEMNILNDNGTVSNTAGLGGVGGAIPNIDLTSMQGEIPSWMQWLVDNKDKVISTITGIVAGLLAFKTLNLLADLGLIGDKLLGIKALGIGIMIAGIVQGIQDVIKYLKDPSWENFGKIIRDIGIVVLGLGIAIESLPVIIAGVLVIIVGLVIQNWNAIKGILDRASEFIRGLGDKAIKFIDGKLDWIENDFGLFGLAVAGVLQFVISFVINTVANMVQFFKNGLDTIFTGFKNVFDGIIRIFKGDFFEGIKQVGTGILQIFTGLWEIISSTFHSCWNGILQAFQNGGKIFNGMKDGIVNVFKTVVNGLIDGINRAIAIPFNKMNNLLNGIKSINVMGIQPFYNSFSYNPIPVPKIPKLATGGIINMPRKRCTDCNGWRGTEQKVLSL